MMGLRKKFEEALKEINELRKENEELKRRLSLYENPHTSRSEFRIRFR